MNTHEQTVPQTACCTHDTITHLIDDNTLDASHVAQRLSDLITDQNHRIKHGHNLSPLPLLWLAMALAAGLQVIIEFAVITGPHDAHERARQAGLEIETYATNAANAIGRIVDGPHNPPCHAILHTARRNAPPVGQN